MSKSKMLLLAIIACFLWGSAFPTVKLMYQELGIGEDIGIKALLAGIRFISAGILIFIFYIIKNKKLPFKGFRWQMIVLGIFQTTLMYSFFYIALYNSTGIKSAILSQSGVFFVVIFSHFIYINDKFNYRKAIGLILGILGILLGNIDGFNAKSIFEFKIEGEGFLIITGLFSAIGTFLVKKWGQSMDSVLMNGWQMFFGGVILVIFGFIYKEEVLNVVSVNGMLLFMYLIIISAIAFTLWYILLEKNKASELTIVKLTIPIFGAFLSAFFIIGETLSIFNLVSLILVLLGVYICNYKQGAKNKINTIEAEKIAG